MVSVCFVCLGNICRSPTAEAVMRFLVERAGLAEHIEIDSAGTGDWHIGRSPDPRSIAAGRRHGFELTGKARQFGPEDFERFDYVLALDASNWADLNDLAPSRDAAGKIRLLRSFDPNAPENAGVPDPYYTEDGFDEVVHQCKAACEGLLAEIRERHGL